MSFFWDSFVAAIRLVLSLDRELLDIVTVSLSVSCSSTTLSALIALPLGFWITFSSFKSKRLLITILNTLLSLPTVVIGLFVYTFLSRRGIFGSFELLYTTKAIVIGQVILIVPLITALTIAALDRIDKGYWKTARTLGASDLQAAFLVFQEGRFSLIAVLITAFGRVISEIGISMMLGGNIKGFTRTMTTAMALEYDKGAFVLAISLGLVLLSISLLMNILFAVFQGSSGK
ncbi:MAG: ABC transporter permease [Deltaproteobacteria bacterium]|nr:MAG: ABC transporter permease [Deltaproteobacteria bacterium]PIE72137.1 MAG: ABC transporter permease [Deltaproteobacteria bacterium]